MNPDLYPEHVGLSLASSRWRRLLMRTHLLVALVLGLLVSVVTLAGAFSVFRPDLERWACAQDVVGVPGLHNYTQIATGLRQRYPDMKIASLTAAAAGDPDTWQLRERGHGLGAHAAFLVYTDARTGAWMGDTAASRVARICDAVAQFHHNLWLRPWGSWLVASAGAALFTLCLTGTWLSVAPLSAWWRTLRQRGIRIGGLLQGHALLGAVVAPVLLIVAVSGMLNTIPQWRRLAMPHADPPMAPVSSVPTSDLGRHRADWEQIIVESADQVPGTTLCSVQAPRSGDDDAVWRVVRRYPGDVSPKDGVVVLFGATGGCIGIQDPRVLGAPRRWLLQEWGFHIGWFGGLTTRVLWCMVGCAPTCLLASGVILWLRPRTAGPGVGS